MADDLRIELITDPADFDSTYTCISNAFGNQTADGVWIGMNPDWDTPEGKKRHAADLVKRWKSGQASKNIMFLKASLPDGESTGRRIVGAAIWVHASLVPGQGEPHSEPDFASLYPDDAREQRWLQQAIRGLHRARIAALENKAAQAQDKSDPAQTSLMVLDLCIVDPPFQGRGIAKQLVTWGLDEARRRGGIEAAMEASAMGRHVYARLGFKQVGGEVDYQVDEEFRDRPLPSNVFMRTGSSS
jgi:GNAT superfamily N-acetyltransferase